MNDLCLMVIYLSCCSQQTCQKSDIKYCNVSVFLFFLTWRACFWWKLCNLTFTHFTHIYLHCVWDGWMLSLLCLKDANLDADECLFSVISLSACQPYQQGLEPTPLPNSPDRPADTLHSPHRLLLWIHSDINIMSYIKTKFQHVIFFPNSAWYSLLKVYF